MNARTTPRPSILLLLALAVLATGLRAVRADDRPAPPLPPPRSIPGPAAPACPAAPLVPPAAPPAPDAPLVPRGPSPAPAVAPAASPTSIGAALTPAQRAEKAFLEHLGWRFVVDPSVARITVAGGTPTRRRDLASAHAAGDLRVLVPPAPTADDVARFVAALPELADSVASRGAWQFLVAPAVERATAKLAANAASGAWTFPMWGPMHAQIFSMSPPRSSWVKRKKVCYAKEKPSVAIEAFYGERASTECFVAQSIAAYAIEYEIYGPAWFDEVFAADEIAIGQVEHFHTTPIGKTMNSPPGYPWRALFLRPSDYDGTDLGLVLARLGPLAFPGLTGILMDQEGRRLSNQNLTFVSVSPAAVDALVRNGGFPHFAERTRALLELDVSAHQPFVTGAELVDFRARMDAILSDPVFGGIRVYIHPYGIVTLGEIVAKLLRRDGTALELILYDEAREDAFFQRYRSAWKARWGRTSGAR